ncbi:MAG: hypothetical protein H0X30_02110 [Anaerolineae bacterium]|nr:hypothetical protein [Anaerolineae bacterium]
MPITVVTGDPLTTQAQTLAFGFNAKGRVEVGGLETRLYDAYPSAFASFRKQCNSDRIKPGMLWMWREAQFNLLFLVVRESSVGMTRMRYVENVLMTIARDYPLYGLTSIALAPLGNKEEWVLLRPVVDYWLKTVPLPVTVYEEIT